MKRIFFFAALVFAAASCEKTPQDFPIVGNFTLTGESTNASTSSWYPGEQIGVFVTSDGVAQTNLLYVPSETCADESMDLDGSKYWMFGDAIGNVTLTAKGEAAGFKQGVHTIYAYSPYNAAATDLTAVPMPDLANQDNTVFNGLSANPALSFVYAKKEVKEYSTAPVDFGKFTCLTYALNTGSIEFADEAAVGKTLVKLVIKADKTIAYKNATFNLEEGKINGEASDDITIKTNLPVDKSFSPITFTDAIGTLDGARFVMVAPATVDELKAMKFTFEGHLNDGSVYTQSGLTPKVYDLGGGAVVVSLAGASLSK